MEDTTNDIRENATVTPKRYAVAYYDDSNVSGQWIYYTEDDLASDTITFEAGQSYAISRGSDGSLTFTGTLETNDISTAVVAGEWNAIGNPYAALLPVNGNSDNNFIMDNINNLDSSFSGIYTWDSSQNKYVGYSLISDDFLLNAGEGFFALPATSTSNIDFGEDLRQGEDSSQFSRSSSDKVSINLIASSTNTSVKTAINFLDTASKGLDQGYDLGNFGGAEFDIYTKIADGSTDVDYTIQSLGTNDIYSLKLSVGIIAIKGTEITITMDSENIPSGIEVYLLDASESILANLSEGDYTFTAKEDLSGAGNLFVQTSAKSLSNTEIESGDDINVYQSANKEITIAGITETYELNVYTLDGKVVLSTEVSTANNVVATNLSTGVYIVQLNKDGKIYNQKIVLE